MVDGVSVFFLAQCADSAGHALSEDVTKRRFAVNHVVDEFFDEIGIGQLHRTAKVQIIQKSLFLAHGKPCEIPDGDIPFIQTILVAQPVDQTGISPAIAGKSHHYQHRT